MTPEALCFLVPGLYPRSGRAFGRRAHRFVGTVDVRAMPAVGRGGSTTVVISNFLSLAPGLHQLLAQLGAGEIHQRHDHHDEEHHRTRLVILQHTEKAR